MILAIWHRLRGHTVHKGYHLLSPRPAWLCEDCDIQWWYA